MSSERQLPEVGCGHCDHWFAGHEHWHAAARWNWYAYEKWRQKGKAHPDLELYRLLYERAELEDRSGQLLLEQEEYLRSVVSARWPLQVGDFFVAPRWLSGTWEVLELRPVWGYNCGPICIARVARIRPGGLPEAGTLEVWPRDIHHVRKVDPLWSPRQWSQVVCGDRCKYLGTPCTVLRADPTKREARVVFGGGRELVLRRLQGIEVPIERVRADRLTDRA